MLGTLTLPLTLAALVAAAPAPDARCIEVVGSLDEVLREMYQGGQSFEAFLDGASRRRAQWLSNYAGSEGPAALLARARAVPGTWRLLVVAVDACSDSVGTIPFTARLVEDVEGLDMRIVDSSVGRAVMDAHRTPDGRGATPTLVLLDADWNEAGCFIERPLTLQDWIGENQGRLSPDALFEGKMAWYDDDAGRSTVRQVVEMMEAAAAGKPVCR